MCSKGAANVLSAMSEKSSVYDGGVCLKLTMLKQFDIYTIGSKGLFNLKTSCMS